MRCPQSADQGLSQMPDKLHIAAAPHPHNLISPWPPHPRPPIHLSTAAPSAIHMRSFRFHSWPQFTHGPNSHAVLPQSSWDPTRTNPQRFPVHLLCISRKPREDQIDRKHPPHAGRVIRHWGDSEASSRRPIEDTKQNGLSHSPTNCAPYPRRPRPEHNGLSRSLFTDPPPPDC